MAGRYRITLIVNSPLVVEVAAASSEEAHDIARRIEDDVGDARARYCTAQGALFVPGDEVIDVDVERCDAV